MHCDDKAPTECQLTDAEICSMVLMSSQTSVSDSEESEEETQVEYKIPIDSLVEMLNTTIKGLEKRDFISKSDIMVFTMSYMLEHLHNGWQVDRAILSEEDRLVVIRFGHDWDPTCMKMDETLYKIAQRIKNFAVIYLVDTTEVPDFNKMYELYDPCTLMFFFRNKHIQIDLGTGNNNKINWAIEDKNEMIDILEVLYRGARKGRGLVISPKDYSTKYRY
ncbi:Thioredoxin-like protein 4A [Araneus ventricosus]|uniref:Thioredoxin-like protein 4A n=7 Tax=Entelegynae TaxID=74971 RepID=A0A4Y2EW21_ARAVE|nr:Thioredoxin-like protein 4A [Araneus ventricosus]